MNLGTIVRLFAIALGIASATLLATKAFGFTFNNDFLKALDLVENLVGGVVLFFDSILLLPAVNWLHAHGFTFELHPHWKSSFVLLWLFFAADMRAFASPSNILGDAGLGTAIRTPLRWAWALLAALIGGALAGTVPLDHPAVLWWSVMAWFLYVSGDDLIHATEDPLYIAFGTLALLFTGLTLSFAVEWLHPAALTGEPSIFWWAVAAFFVFRTINAFIFLAAGRSRPFFPMLLLAIAVVSSVLALGLIPGFHWPDLQRSGSPGLANLAAFVCVLALEYLLFAFIAPAKGVDSYSARVMNTNHARTALDVLSVLGGAATIVYVGHVLA